MLAFFKSHPRLARTPAGQRAILAALLRRVERLEGQVRALRSARRIENHPLYDGFMCIHSHEGAWTANTGNGYYGGLQQDWSFMETYGPELLARYGTADKWPPADQIRVAIRAYESGRGWWPWPTTARMCGLL